MRNGINMAGMVYSAILTGAMIILSVNGVWGEKKGVTPELIAPAPKLSQMKVASFDSTMKIEMRKNIRIGKHPSIPYHPIDNMPIFKPDSTIDHKILVLKPDPNIDYKIQTIGPDHIMKNIGEIYTIPGK